MRSWLASLYIWTTHGGPYHGYGYVPLKFVGNVVRRIGTQQQHYCIQSDIAAMHSPYSLVRSGGRGGGSSDAMVLVNFQCRGVLQFG